MAPDSSDLAENLTPGVFFHEDSESGLQMAGFRGKRPNLGQKLAKKLAKFCPGSPHVSQSYGGGMAVRQGILRDVHLLEIELHALLEEG